MQADICGYRVDPMVDLSLDQDEAMLWRRATNQGTITVLLPPRETYSVPTTFALCLLAFETYWNRPITRHLPIYYNFSTVLSYLF
jgi:hypothetical protein